MSLVKLKSCSVKYVILYPFLACLFKLFENNVDFVCFENRVSLCIPGRPRAQYTDPPGLELTETLNMQTVFYFVPDTKTSCFNIFMFWTCIFSQREASGRRIMWPSVCTVQWFSLLLDLACHRVREPVTGLVGRSETATQFALSHFPLAAQNE